MPTNFKCSMQKKQESLKKNQSEASAHIGKSSEGDCVFKTDSLLITIQDKNGKTVKEYEKPCKGTFNSINDVIKFATDNVIMFPSSFASPTKWAVYDGGYSDYFVTLTTRDADPYDAQGNVAFYSIDVGCYVLTPAPKSSIDKSIAPFKE